MTHTITFDLLIVYTEKLAKSASSSALTPFRPGSNSGSYNTVYGYFLDTCKKNGLNAAFTTSKDINGAGRCNSFWTFKANQWQKSNHSAFSKLIFDKFSPTNPKIKASRDLLFSSAKIKPFNQHRLFELFFDKQKAFAKLADFSIPTVTIDECTKKSLKVACESLKRLIKKHPHNSDFSSELIIKDRFGAGGLKIFKVNSEKPDQILKLIGECPKKSFVIQPFISFDQGFRYQNTPVSTDIRLIYLGGKIVQTYIRMAKAGDFRCNEHQGGRLKYISKKIIPLKVFKAADKISAILNQKKGLFALDFIISNNGNVYLLEGNTGPGLDWNLEVKENELEAKKLIRAIVKQIAKKTIHKLKPAPTKVIFPLDIDFDYPETATIPLII